jgi:hypothetical protein
MLRRRLDECIGIHRREGPSLERVPANDRGELLHHR